MSATILPRWFWSEEEEVQPPSRDGWTVHLGGGQAVVADVKPSLQLARSNDKAAATQLNAWLCESLARRS